MLISQYGLLFPEQKQTNIHVACDNRAFFEQKQDLHRCVSIDHGRRGHCLRVCIYLVVSVPSADSIINLGRDCVGSNARAAPHEHVSVQLASCFLHSEALRKEASVFIGKLE